MSRRSGGSAASRSWPGWAGVMSWGSSEPAGPCAPKRWRVSFMSIPWCATQELPRSPAALAAPSLENHSSRGPRRRWPAVRPSRADAYGAQVLGHANADGLEHGLLAHPALVEGRQPIRRTAHAGAFLVGADGVEHDLGIEVGLVLLDVHAQVQHATGVGQRDQRMAARMRDVEHRRPVRLVIHERLAVRADGQGHIGRAAAQPAPQQPPRGSARLCEAQPVGGPHEARGATALLGGQVRQAVAQLGRQVQVQPEDLDALAHGLTHGHELHGFPLE